MNLGQWLGTWAGRWLGAVLGTRHRVTPRPAQAVVSVGRPTVTLRPMPAPEPSPGGGWLPAMTWAPPRHRIVARPITARLQVGAPRAGRDLFAEDEELLLLM